VVKYLRRLLDLHLELVEEVEREFASGRHGGGAPSGAPRSPASAGPGV
jgi:hypothetical protein